MGTILLWASFIGFFTLGNAMVGGHLHSFIQPTSLVIVFGPCITYIFFCLGIQGILPFIGRALNRTASDDDRAVADSVSAAGFLFGLLGAVSGMIHVMSNLTDSSRLGAGIAVAFISVVYGSIPAIILLPLNGRGFKSARSKSAAGYMTVGLLLVLSSFFIVLYALSGK